MAGCSCFEFSYIFLKDAVLQVFSRLVTVVDLLLLSSWSPIWPGPIEPTYPLTDMVIYLRVTILNVLIFYRKSTAIWPDVCATLCLGFCALYATNLLLTTMYPTLVILSLEFVAIVWSPDRRRQRRLWTHNATFRIAAVWNPFQRSIRRSLLLPLVSRHNTPVTESSLSSLPFQTSVNTTKVVVSSFIDIVPEGIVGHNAERRLLHVHALHAPFSESRRLVFLHQFGAGAFTWHSVMTLLANGTDGSGCLVAFDRLAHGMTFASERLSNTRDSTPLSEDLSQAVNFNDVIQEPNFEPKLIDIVNDRIQPETTPLYLISCGGAGATLALEYLHMHPGAVAGIVFISPYLMSTDGVPSVLRSVASAAVGRALTVSMAKTEVTSLIPRRSWEGEVPPSLLKAYAKSVDVPGWEDAMIQYLRKPAVAMDHQGACADIRCLVVGGDSDHFVNSVDEYALFAAAIGNAPYVCLPRCGAAPQEERPELVADLIRTFTNCHISPS